ADLIAYRRRTETIIEKRLTMPFRSVFGGEFQMHVYANRISYAEHIALVKGDLSGDEPVLVRMHAINVLEDVLGDGSHGRGGEIQAAMQAIEKEGRGVIVLLREPQPSSLSERLQAELLGVKPDGNLRDYGVGAQILVALGIKKMILLTNSPNKLVVGLDGYGLSVEGHRSIKSDT
ncbi:MAG: 3,4-dihydroxy-2-butanone-4-phosphate synthase, partial [Alphaproteobacteria bacterium]|nr:3,4-dihydroxy-2-butanone-4-phosphate synthase [Alphaproteobacteria bacterium]